MKFRLMMIVPLLLFHHCFPHFIFQLSHLLQGLCMILGFPPLLSSFLMKRSRLMIKPKCISEVKHNLLLPKKIIQPKQLRLAPPNPLLIKMMLKPSLGPPPRTPDHQLVIMLIPFSYWNSKTMSPKLSKSSNQSKPLWLDSTSRLIPRFLDLNPS